MRPENLTSHPTTRRRFLARIALGCIGMAGLRVVPLDSTEDAATRLALRIVQAMGSVPALRHMPTRSQSLAQLLSSAFEPDTLAHLMRLDTTQLKHWLAQRIAVDYQKGALVNHYGWWLAASEAVILDLGCLLTERQVPLR